MGEHGAGGGGVEPAQVHHGLGLAGADKVPCSVGPGLYPGVVALGMGPAGRINLAGRDTHGAQGGHAEGGLLPASAQGILEGSQGGVGAPVGRLVGHLFMAPVVHLQDGLLHGELLYAGLELVVKHRAGAVQVFVVGPEGQHKVTEFPLRHLPGHLFAGLERLAHVGQVELGRVVRDIGQGHVGIEELQGLFFTGRYALGQGHELGQGAVMGLKPGLVIPVERGGGTAGRQKAPCRQKG